MHAGPVEPGEDDRVGELRAEARREAADQRGGARLLAAEAPEGEAAVFVGRIDSAVVGYASVVAGAEVGTICELYVEPEARGVGVGEALFDVAADWLVQAGCRTVDAAALPGNRAAKQFFEARGLVARLIVMSRAIPADSGS